MPDPDERTIGYAKLKALVEERRRRHQARPLPLRKVIEVWWRCRRLSLSRSRVYARAFWQRGRRGWADSDVASLDCYMTQVLAGALAHMAALRHGYPGEGTPWDTPEKWDAYLRDLSSRLARWNDDTLWDSEAYETTRAAMEEFGRNLGHFWI